MDPKSFAASKTIIFNILMGLTSMGVLKGLTLTPEQLMSAIEAIITLWAVGGVVLRFFTKRPVSAKSGSGAAALLLALCLAPLLGACTTTQTVSPAVDTRLARAEAILATANFAAQEAIASGWIKAKDAPKVQAAIRAAAIALDQARRAVADGRLDASDAVSAAVRAANDLGPILSAFRTNT